MRDLRSKNKVKIEAGSSSMTDLVFLLLIFFIIISTQVNNSNIPLEVPSATVNDPQDPKEVIKISVAPDNQFYVGTDGKLVSQEDLAGAIMNEVIMTGDSIVELSGDKSSSWESNVAVIDIAKQNGLKLVIKTKP